MLVNNAGFGDLGPFARADLAKMLRMIQVNVTALTELTGLFLPGMLARGRGRILNVGSVAGFQPGPLMAVYYATKAFVNSFSEALSNEVAGTGVTVTCLAPGPTASEFDAAAGMAPTKHFTVGRGCAVGRRGGRARDDERKAAGRDRLAEQLLLFAERFSAARDGDPRGAEDCRRREGLRSRRSRTKGTATSTSDSASPTLLRTSSSRSLAADLQRCGDRLVFRRDLRQERGRMGAGVGIGMSEAVEKRGNREPPDPLHGRGDHHPRARVRFAEQRHQGHDRRHRGRAEPAERAGRVAADARVLIAQPRRQGRHRRQGVHPEVAERRAARRRTRAEESCIDFTSAATRFAGVTGNSASATTASSRT